MAKAARNQIDSTDTLTVNEIRKAVRTLKKAKARPFADDGRRPHYICICSPDAVYDLQNDSLWQDVSKYSGAENIYSGEIGRLFGVVFVESTEAKVIRQAMLTKLVSHEAGSDTFTVAEMTDRAAETLMRLKKVTVGSATYNLKSIDKAAKSITLTVSLSNALAKDSIVYTTEAGKLDANKKAADVHMSVIFGRDAYGVIDLENGALESIVKPRRRGRSARPARNGRREGDGLCGSNTERALDSARRARRERLSKRKGAKADERGGRYAH